MIISVIENKNFDEYEILEEEIINHCGLSNIDKIIMGDARGADELIANFANKHNIESEIIELDIQQYGRLATTYRGKDVMAASDFTFVFWDGKSKETLDIMKQCYKLGQNQCV